MRRLSVFATTKPAEQGVVDLAPMLDLVFILLIFFIATGSFVAGSGIEVAPPDASTASMERSVRILVAVSAENRVWIGGEETDLHQLRRQLESLHAENPHGALLVQADARSSASTVARVLDAARLAGMADAALSVQRQP